MLEDFLPLVTRPARYINNEINAVHKDLSRVATKVCLLFPDAYEVGMSHLGLRILYHVLNSRPDTACERVFSPWPDYEERLRASGRPLKSLESGLPLAQFDIIGVTLQYELSYSNILTGLELAGIPPCSSQRDDGHPVIVAGGPCAVNPEPLSDFIDVFFIGEAEEAIHELVEARQAERTRSGFLEAISRREGFYVPALGKSTVRRRFLRDIETAPYPDRPLLPLLKPVHDRVTVEVARGCIRGCRFCQAGIIYRPYRERSAERIKDLLSESLACTGYEELSLASLSSGDHSGIQPLIIELMKKYREGRVSVSLPSLRVGTLTPEMIEAIAGTRKTGFTLAPEAGTERLRRVINKPVSDQDLLDAAETVFKNGWSVLKLYFMIGLPTETDADLDGIVRLANEILPVGKRVSKRHVQLNISVSTFVPKPHTPFQWMGQARLEEVRAKQAYLGAGLRKRGIVLKAHDPETSLLEGAFARGDRALGRVIAEAVRLGCRFDGWTEWFDFKKWTGRLRGMRDGPRRARLPGLRPGRRASLGPCEERGFEGISEAGIPEGRGVGNHRKLPGGLRALRHRVYGRRNRVVRKTRGSTATAPAQEQPAPGGKHAGPQDMTARIRMKYTKTGRIRFLSHLDFMTLVHRAAARAGVPLALSQGFNPHPRIAFGPALSVGMESETEFLDLETDPFADVLEVTKALNKALPQGVRILESRVIPKKAPSLSGCIGRYEYEVSVQAAFVEGMEERVRDFLARPAIMVSKEGKEKDIRPGMESIIRRTPGSGLRSAGDAR